MTKEEKMLLASIEDKQHQCENRNIITTTPFLSMAEQTLAEDNHVLGPSGHFFGGTEDAERRIIVFLPDYLEEIPQGEDCPLCILRVTYPKGSRPLSHRDYLGSLLSLGVGRSVAGDIFVREGGADIIIVRDMADFFLQNYCQAGHINLSCTIHELEELQPGIIKKEEFRDTVASLRLDSIAASCFKMSRGNAQEAVKQGLVFVNNRQILKPDHILSEGDRIVLRGKGKAVLKEVGGKSRKDRDCIVCERYL
ncbi:MAG: YlmH/Sll1252 family protein, partial [Clostridia bacterium]|nr:YlmH/Sll1252 family protein [Clostridia bacterium]